jgi:hypothetical protein
LSVLGINRAFSEIASTKKKIDSVPQLIAIEEDRVEAINKVTLGTEQQVEAYQLAKSIADSLVLTVGTDGGKPVVLKEWRPNAYLSAELQNQITRAETLQSIAINNANAAATIRKLLL